MLLSSMIIILDSFPNVENCQLEPALCRLLFPLVVFSDIAGQFSMLRSDWLSYY